MSWAEERRQNRLTDADIRRADADADVDRGIKLTQAAEQAGVRRRARQMKALRGAAGWLGGHATELLIYPLALVCAGMAVPAMAHYGHDLYGDATGYALPIVTELGMWAFAMAVLFARRDDPDRPTPMLNVGIAASAAVGGGLNFAHGLGHGVSHGLAMAIVSVFGVGAHQLAVARAPRSRAERAEARIARQAARRVTRTRRIAARTAVVDLAPDGSARLVHRPGLYVPGRRHLDPTTVPGLPVDQADPTDDWDAALADLDVDGGPVEPGLRLDPPTEDPTESGHPTTEADQQVWPGGSGRVAVLDPDESDPESGDDDPGRPGPARPIDPQARRKLPADEALDAARRLARRTGKRLTAAQLTKALQVGSDTARKLRDQVNAEVFGGGVA
ncbi:hypothetical protein [Candidatus Frankia nodulisporulans]|uniref:hypothetical protein n=1 Tax=Candidatus Frankia nodulisporulans TaxID=2060052 RepID=UPI0013D0F5CD|nr:hypothetical protein [Candidatus Frankia nodulisporulans]